MGSHVKGIADDAQRFTLYLTEHDATLYFLKNNKIILVITGGKLG